MLVMNWILNSMEPHCEEPSSLHLLGLTQADPATKTPLPGVSSLVVASHSNCNQVQPFPIVTLPTTTTFCNLQTNSGPGFILQTEAVMHSPSFTAYSLVVSSLLRCSGLVFSSANCCQHTELFQPCFIPKEDLRALHCTCQPSVGGHLLSQGKCILCPMTLINHLNNITS